ncbi:DUF4423 domain-containing protein, partial [Bacteriovoracaceae bacterium]|nr:DUF4423 domain-containing protein [Bacteriovoracaceae bacterium]
MIFDYDSYRVYLTEIFNRKGNRGIRTRLAEYLNCQAGFISQVLSGGKVHFSLEHIEKIATFLEFSYDEKKFFITLYLFEKSGSVDLENYFKLEVEELRRQFQDIGKKIKTRNKELNDYQKSVYYSHWGYITIHMLVSLEDCNTIRRIQQRTKLNESFVLEILNFLLDCQLIEKTNNRFIIGPTRIHLSKSSPLLKLLHTNMRQLAVNKMDHQAEENLHYSSVLVFGKDDIEKVRHLILNFIAEKEK